MSKFIAIDFETANGDPDSACALGLVKVSRKKIGEIRCDKGCAEGAGGHSPNL